jgi:hypothetical protein
MGAQAKLFALELKKSSWTVVQLILPMFAAFIGVCRAILSARAVIIDTLRSLAKIDYRRATQRQ